MIPSKEKYLEKYHYVENYNSLHICSNACSKHFKTGSREVLRKHIHYKKHEALRAMEAYTELHMAYAFYLIKHAFPHKILCMQIVWAEMVCCNQFFFMSG